MPKRKIRIGLIGLGGIAMAHEWGYKEKPDQVEIVAVCDIDSTRAKTRAAPYNAKIYTDYREMMSDPDVDAVDITLPHTLHYLVAKAALEAKKHVAMEKPLTVHSPEGLELIRLAQKQGVKFMVTENTRFVEAYIKVHQLIQSGELGEPRVIRTFISGSEVARLSRTENWKGRKDGTGGGAILDAGAHSIYLLKWLAGEIDQVWGYKNKLVEASQVEDSGMIGGRLRNGALFSTEYSFVVEAPWNERLEYHGSKGSVVVDQLTDPPALHYRGGRDTKGVTLDVPYQPGMWKLVSIKDGVKDFVDALWEDRSPSVDPMDAWYAIHVIDKAYAAIEQIKPFSID
jgi:predicted dehydrogenase